MKTRLVHVLLIVLGFAPALLEAQTLTRGPYLQMGSTTATTVRWRTSSSTDSVVRFGTIAGSLTATASHSTSKTEHEVRLTGLSPNTTYYYSIGNSTTTLESGAGYFFVTAPLVAKPTRIWVLGDAGTGSSVQANVRNAYYTFTGPRHTDLWLMLGDNAYNSGTDAEYTSKMFNIYPDMFRKSVLWTTIGNHDAASADSPTQTGPYYLNATLPKQAEAGGVASGTEAYYSFDYGNIHFVCLDSQDTDRSPTGAMATWLKTDLQNNTKDWLVAFFHHPPYSKGSHNSDTSSTLVQMRQNFVPILEAYGVDLVLAGHSHSYERSYFIDGHYGTSDTFNTGTMVKQTGGGQGVSAYTKSTVGPLAHAGAVYAVAGASGQISGGNLNHPAMFVSLNVAGSMVLDVNGNRLDATYLDSGGVIQDFFSMVKGAATANAKPEVVITSPSNGSVFVPGSNITINASAADSDGTVTSVEFYQGQTLLGTASSSPYSVLWSAAPVGSYQLTAKAFDNTGAFKASTAVSITVGNISPSVTITSPSSGASFQDPANIVVNASASDSDGTVSRVDFYHGATLIGSDSSAPYTASWSGVAAGSYSLTAVATDNAGGTTTSPAVTISVTPPGASITVAYQQGADGYTGMIDTTIRSDAATTNYGSSTTLLLDGSPDYSALLQWNLTGIPAGKTVTAASITLQVENVSSEVYEVYALKRAWSESSATWNRASSNTNWHSAGAKGNNDRETTVLGTISSASTGAKVIALNAAGVSKVQSWINNPSTNFGFVIQDYALTDGIDLTSSEGVTVSQRPKLTITYK